MKLKIQIKWMRFLLFFVVIFGIYHLTQSFWMTLGIILLLFVVDNFLKEYDDKKRRERNRQE